jgi:acyl-CoA synthetase (AMP-forming)/AMP-acid ligase II
MQSKNGPGSQDPCCLRPGTETVLDVGLPSAAQPHPVLKVPKDIQFLDALPREASGKIFKRKLRDLHAEGRLRAIA